MTERGGSSAALMEYSAILVRKFQVYWRKTGRTPALWGASSYMSRRLYGTGHLYIRYQRRSRPPRRRNGATAPDRFGASTVGRIAKIPHRWRFADIKHGSAIVVVRGEVEASETSDAPERVIRGIGIVAASLATGDPIPYSPPVQEAAIALTRAIHGSLPRFIFRRMKAISC